MYDDLKENIILLMQHPIARRPISNLSDEEREKAFDLLNYLSTLSVDENYTLLDYIQMARLEYALGELEYQTTNDTEKVIRHFRTACAGNWSRVRLKYKQVDRVSQPANQRRYGIIQNHNPYQYI